MSRDLLQLRQKIVVAATANVREMLQHVWQEPDSRIDVWRVINSGHNKHL
jgi:hypothetical protein